MKRNHPPDGAFADQTDHDGEVKWRRQILGIAARNFTGTRPPITRRF
jgi:hypothetical protein